MHALISQRKDRAQLTFFLYNNSEFIELKHLSATDVWPDVWKAIPILKMDAACPPPDGLNAPVYRRFEPVSQLISRLERLCQNDATAKAAAMGIADSLIKQSETADDPSQQAETAAANSIQQAENTAAKATQQAETNAANRDGQVRDSAALLDTSDAPIRLWLTIALTAGESRSNGRQRLVQLIRDGRQVIYLPLMPTYQMDAIQSVSQGPTVSDLLLRLLGDSIGPDDIGCYWQPHPDGYLCFRPPQRADDLVTCEPDILRRLILLLKAKLNEDPTGQMLALIHCAGLPLASVAAAAVLCDVCEIDLPQGSSYMAVSAQIEAGRLLALLPASCRVIRHIHPDIPDQFPQKGVRQDLAMSS